MSKENIKAVHHRKIKNELLENKEALYSLKVKNIYLYHILNSYVDITNINILVDPSVDLEELIKFIEKLFPSFNSQNFVIISSDHEIISFVLGELIF